MNHGDLDFTEVVTFGDLLVRSAERWASNDALIIDDDRRTYRQLLEGSVLVARSLRGMGIGHGDHVGLLLPNCIDGVEIMFGASMLGAVIVPINARFKARELAHVISDGDIKVLLTSDKTSEHVDFVTLLREALPLLGTAADPLKLDLPDFPMLTSVVTLGRASHPGLANRDALDAAAGDVSETEVHRLRRQVAIRSTALMIYTSGTTAMPKGCPMSHESLVRTSIAAGRETFGYVSNDRFWDPLPIFHMSFILPMIGVLDAGGAFISCEHFEPGAALKQMIDERVTGIFPTFPAVVQALLNHPDYQPDALQRVRITTAVAPPDALRAMQAQLPHAVQISAYGLTECGGVVSYNDPSDSLDLRVSTQGRPFRGVEVCAKDESGHILPPDSRGELCVRGFSVFEGYYKDPEKNAESFDADGWFHTGDLGWVDSDGRVSYQGRLKDMLKVGGENVAAIEIESYLMTHEDVSIAQVVGVPDPKYVEVAAAFIELKPGAAVSGDELIAFCRAGLAGFKVPRYVRIVSEWPMSATKVQKFRLRDQICEELGYGQKT